jgi:hypothetical protein
LAFVKNVLAEHTTFRRRVLEDRQDGLSTDRDLVALCGHQSRHVNQGVAENASWNPRRRHTGDARKAGPEQRRQLDSIVHR